MGDGEQLHALLDEALDSAAELCRRAMADYRAGLIDEDELRQLLLRAGTVQWPDQVWLLDLQAGRWWRYDGLGLGPDAAMTNAGVTRLRDVVDELTGATRDASGGGDR